MTRKGLRWLVKNMSLGLSVLAVAIAFTLLVRDFRGETIKTEFVVSPTDSEAVLISPELADDIATTLAELENIRDDVQQATDSADIILGFIESGSILLGALIALGVVVFGASIKDVRNDIDEMNREAERRIQQNEAIFTELQQHIREQMERAISEAENRVESSEKRIEDLGERIKRSIDETEETNKTLHLRVDEAVQKARLEAEKSFEVLSLLLLAEQQVRARNRASAITTLNKAYDIDPHNQTTNYLLGYLYVGRKAFDTAIEHLERALRVDPNFAPALAAMGLAQRRMGDTLNDPSEEMKRRQLYAQAEFNLSKALEADPSLIDADDESYFGTLGGLYRRQGRLEDALRAYEDAVRITPTNSYPVVNLATLYKKLGHEAEAKRMYARVIELTEAILDDYPGDTWARLDLAQALLTIGQKEAALKQFDNVIERITETSSLEAAKGVLDFLSDTPQPIDGIEDAREKLQAAIKNLQENPPKFEV